MMPDIRLPRRIPSSSSGFSLVELMVAMVIGLVIILGAGQLFLTVFQTNRQVELLSEKQAAITFLTEDLIREVRRGEFDAAGYRLSRIKKNEEPAVIERKDGANFQALVGGLMMPQGASEENILFSNSSYGLATSSDAVTTFDFELESVDGNREPIKFIAVDRTTAVGGSKGGAESGGGETGGGETGGGETGGGETGGGETGGSETGGGETGGGETGGGETGGGDTGGGETGGGETGGGETGGGDTGGGDEGTAFCVNMIITGRLIKNANQDEKPSLYVNNLAQGECGFDGNNNYQCPVFGATAGSVVRVDLKVVKKNSTTTRSDRFTISQDCSLKSYE